MRPYKEFIDNGILRKTSKDIDRAKSLIEDSDKRSEFLTELLKNIKLTNDNANYIIENVYDILMQSIRAVLYLEGYQTSGEGSHEAEIAFLQKFSFEEDELKFLDRLRYFRNGIKYYGKRFDVDYANDCVNFARKFKPKLNRLAKID